MKTGASDHVSGKKSLLANITYSQSLPTIALANGSQTMVAGVGQANPLPSLTLNNVFFCPWSL